MDNFYVVLGGIHGFYGTAWLFVCPVLFVVLLLPVLATALFFTRRPTLRPVFLCIYTDFITFVPLFICLFSGNGLLRGGMEPWLGRLLLYLPLLLLLFIARICLLSGSGRRRGEQQQKRNRTSRINRSRDFSSYSESSWPVASFVLFRGLCPYFI